MVDARLEKLDLDEDKLVVHALELAQEAVDEGQGIVVRLLGHVKSNEACLEVLSQEATALRGGPFYT